MLSFFRRALSSYVVLGLLAFLMLAFVITGVETKSGGIAGFGGDDPAAIASVGGRSITAQEITVRARAELERARQQNPSLDMAAFVNQGAITPLIGQMIDTRAIEEWGRKQGVTASPRLVDGEIASVPAFAGPTGQFDPAVMRQVLASQRVSEAQLRRDAAGDLVRRQVLIPLASGSAVSNGMAQPYASLLMEQRAGLIGVVPAASIPPAAAPTDAEIATEYRRNIARYTLPERRTIRYALFGPETVAAQARPGEAEIAAAYKADAAKYAASEQRTLQQVILQDQAAARALAAKVRAGTSFLAAAQAAGFGPADIAVAAKTREAFAALTAPAVAAAAYAAPAGGVTDPVRSPLGWHVVKVDAVTAVAGRSLAVARAEIEKALTERKANEIVTAMVDRLEDAVNDGATLEEAAAKEKLALAVTPALLPNGAVPDQPGFQLPVDLAPLLKPAFDATPDDDPTVESLGATHRYALMALGQVLPAAPRPLAAVRATVVADLTARRAEDRARQVASAIVARAERGMPLAQAFAEAKLGLIAPQPVGARRIDMQRRDREAPPPLQLMFTLAPGKTQLLPVPQGQGFYIVQLQKIVPGDASRDQALVGEVRRQMGDVVSEELLQQFATAAKKVVKVRRHEQAIARMRAELTGQAPPAGQ